jgi:hypothetical protein
VYVLNPWDSPVDVELEFAGAGSTVLRYHLDERSVAEGSDHQRPILRPRPRRLFGKRLLTDVAPPESMVLYRLPANG